MSQELVVQNPLDMVQSALEKGLTGDDLQKMMDLAERFEANEARKAFNVALTEFKKKPPRVEKDRTVTYGGTSYTHASHSQVNEVIGAALAEHDLAHRFEINQENGTITVACVLTHKAGHSERVSLTAAPDTSGSKNSIQAIGSTVTYLERYSLQAATGIAAHDIQDDDGGEPVDTISDEQVADLVALMEEVGANKEKMFGFFKVNELSEIPAANYHKVVQMLEAKRSGTG